MIDIISLAAKRGANWHDWDVGADALAGALTQVATAKQATEAFFWLVVHGVLRFDDISHWYDNDGDDIDDVAPYVHLSERGRLLLARLAE